MKTCLFVILGVVLVVLYIVYDRMNVGGIVPLRPRLDTSRQVAFVPISTLTSTGVCLDASQNGGDAKFVDMCTSYQKICGEKSTFTLVHNIDGQDGLNSDQADIDMQAALASVQKDSDTCQMPSYANDALFQVKA